MLACVSSCACVCTLRASVSVGGKAEDCVEQFHVSACIVPESKRNTKRSQVKLESHVPTGILRATSAHFQCIGL